MGILHKFLELSDKIDIPVLPRYLKDVLETCKSVTNNGRVVNTDAAKLCTTCKQRQCLLDCIRTTFFLYRIFAISTS